MQVIFLFKPPSPAPGPNDPPIQWSNLVAKSWSAKLTSNPHLVPRLNKHGTVTSFHHTP